MADFVINKQVKLQNPVQSLLVPYPADFMGEKTGFPDDEAFTLSMSPRYLTLDEIAVAEDYVKGLGYSQSVSYLGAVRVSGTDPLIMLSHDELDVAESKLGYTNSRYVSSGGERSRSSRVLLIREMGYEGDGTDIEGIIIPDPTQPIVLTLDTTPTALASAAAVTIAAA